MSTLHLTRGLPAAGKTTWAKEWVAAGDNRARVNRDDLRAMLFGRDRLGYAEEELVTHVQRDSVKALLAVGDVVCDDTHLRPRYVREWIRFTTAHGHDVEVHEFPITVEESIARDYARGSKVGEAAIRRMARYLVKGGLAPIPDETEAPAVALYTPNPTLPDAWVVDVDGTLALNTSGRSPYDLTRVGEDSPNPAVVEVVQSIDMAGQAHIVFASGRDDSCRDATVAWLEEHLGFSGPLFMRNTDDRRRDSVVKRELLDKIGNYYCVRGVIDDRNQVVEMWRAAGLTCLQVAEGDF